MVAAASLSAPAPPTTEIGDDSGTPVIMPHITLSETELDARHPRLQAPDEVLSADPGAAQNGEQNNPTDD